MTASATNDGDGTGAPSGQNRPRHLSHLTHRQLIGWLGILLPGVLYLFAGILPSTELPRWELLDSVSAYYYTSATAAFVGMLFALALFLFTYGGYEDDVADRVAGKIGGLCALGVAFFPTVAPPPLTEPSWWHQFMRPAHYVSATLLFVVFIVFSLWLFRKTDVPAGKPLPPDKRWRNVIYLVSGIVMIGCVIWAGTSLFTDAPIFWPESIALVAFAVSWLVKGDVRGTVARLVGDGGA